MRTYLVDDRGEGGEYAHFLKAHADRLPRLSLDVFESWSCLSSALRSAAPDLILLDMHFDEGEVERLCGDLAQLAASVRFGGDLQKAEAQLRRLQGVFIAQELREGGHFLGPVVLFGSLPRQHSVRLVERFGPLRIVEGLLFDGVREALSWAESVLR